MANLTTWEKVKARFDLADAQEAEVENLISVATARADHYTGRTLAAESKTFYCNGEGTPRLIVGQWPINSVTAVYIDNTQVFGAGSEVTDYEIMTDFGALYRAGGWPTESHNVKVIANVGYADIPADLEESIIQLVGYWLQSPQISWLGTGDAQGGGYQTQYVGVMDLPFQVRNVWDYYREVIV